MTSTKKGAPSRHRGHQRDRSVGGTKGSAPMLARRTDSPFRADPDQDPTAARNALLVRYRQELARRTLVLASIRSHLEEQPSNRTIRAAGRRWCADITNLTDAVVAARKDQEDDR